MKTLRHRARPLWILAALCTLGAATSWWHLPESMAQTPAPMTLKPAPATPSPLTALPAPAGEAIAHTCAACHGTRGQLDDEAFMPLAGMPRTQFVRTMQDFRSGARPSTLMGHVADGFTDADLQALGSYFESLPMQEAAR
ncbi:c-type cytochrome [Rubrivivax albus]|uniref:Cytochrome c class I n=1 Tax=Rubrivivax albus TaxID=2499835 RepID=A0A437JXD5_9BURK|nr:cytochrome c class I [Rubrivivax albus]RVT52258.1 cytochrome c class I [Rubrivivax albus]